MTVIESWEETMDAKVLDGCDFATELVREARVDAAEDRFFTNRANMDMAVCLATAGRRRLYTWKHHKGNHHKGACSFVVVFVFERGAGR